MKIKISVDNCFYENKVLLNWIDETFNTQEEKDAAWKTWAFLKKAYPKAEPYLRGELVEQFESKGEMAYGNHTRRNS